MAPTLADSGCKVSPLRKMDNGLIQAFIGTGGCRCARCPSGGSLLVLPCFVVENAKLWAGKDILQKKIVAICLTGHVVCACSGVDHLSRSNLRWCSEDGNVQLDARVGPRGCANRQPHSGTVVGEGACGTGGPAFIGIARALADNDSLSPSFVLGVDKVSGCIGGLVVNCLDFRVCRTRRHGCLLFRVRWSASDWGRAQDGVWREMNPKKNNVRFCHFVFLFCVHCAKLQHLRTQ